MSASRLDPLRSACADKEGFPSAGCAGRLPKHAQKHLKPRGARHKRSCSSVEPPILHPAPILQVQRAVLSASPVSCVIPAPAQRISVLVARADHFSRALSCHDALLSKPSELFCLAYYYQSYPYSLLSPHLFTSTYCSRLPAPSTTSRPKPPSNTTHKPPTFRTPSPHRLCTLSEQTKQLKLLYPQPLHRRRRCRLVCEQQSQTTKPLITSTSACSHCQQCHAQTMANQGRSATQCTMPYK